MAVTSAGDFLSKIKEDFVEISKNAARSAANRAQKDIKAKADKFIDEYYEYPTRYKRKKALYKLIEDHYEEKEVSGGIIIEFGVKYNPDNISGMHKSNSWYRQSGTTWIPRNSGDFDFDSQNNGIPSATWITEKFWEGIHPSGKIGDDGGHSERSSDSKMQEFFDTELEGKVTAYLNEALYSELAKYF